MTKKYDVELKKQLVHAYMQGAYMQGQATHNSKKSMGLPNPPFLDGERNTAKNADTLPNHNQIIHMQRRFMILIKRLPNWKRRTFS